MEISLHLGMTLCLLRLDIGHTGSDKIIFVETV